MAWVWFHKFGSPPHFYRLAGKIIPWMAWPAVLLGVVGTVWGLAFAPTDYQQGEGYRIIFVHVPTAVLSMLIYGVMASAATVGLVWRMTVGFAVANACTVIGASFTVLALVTGSLWGRPMWGTWWEWDPRLTSELLLLFLYLGYMGLRSAIDDTTRADRASAVLALVGVINLPVIHYSVDWWNSLHQGHTFLKAAKPSMPPEMYMPVLLLFVSGLLFFGAIMLMRARGELLLRERKASWLLAALTEDLL